MSVQKKRRDKDSLLLSGQQVQESIIRKGFPQMSPEVLLGLGQRQNLQGVRSIYAGFSSVYRQLGIGHLRKTKNGAAVVIGTGLDVNVGEEEDCKDDGNDIPAWEDKAARVRQFACKWGDAASDSRKRAMFHGSLPD